MGRKWGLHSSGNKTDLIYRNILFLQQVKEDGNDIIQNMACNVECPSFEKFANNRELICVDWKEPPSKRDMAETLKKAGDKFEDQEQGAATQVNPHAISQPTDSIPNFTLSEFARLIVILQEDERAREAMFRLSQELQSCELDGGVTRAAFWQVIADRFNDISLPISFSFEGDIEETDPSQVPLCSRPASTLKSQFHDARSVLLCFTWSRSGQNDPDRFQDSLSKNGMQFYASSKRALIIFVVSRSGTPWEDTFFLDMASKVIHQSGCEAGMPSGYLGCDGGASEGNSIIQDGKKRKRNNIDVARC